MGISVYTSLLMGYGLMSNLHVCGACFIFDLHDGSSAGRNMHNYNLWCILPGSWDFNFLPTNGFSIKPLTVKLLAGEQNATEKYGLHVPVPRFARPPPTAGPAPQRILGIPEADGSRAEPPFGEQAQSQLDAPL